MKTIKELTNIIKTKIVNLSEQYSARVGKSFSCEVLPERDYVVKTSNNRDEYDELSPSDVVDRNRIYFVIKFGRGEYNFALSSMPVTIEVVSEEDSMDAAQTILREFVNSVNYIYESGIIQTYFLPSVVTGSNEIRTGYRALIEIQGRIYNFEDITGVVTKIVIDNNEIPFINFRYGWSTQPNPQSFPTVSAGSDKNGATYNINRQHTKSFSVNTYLWNTAGTGAKQTFSTKIIQTLNTNMNNKFHVELYTNHNIKLTDAYYTLTSFSYDQQLGTPNAATFVFSECEPEAVTSNGNG